MSPRTSLTVSATHSPLTFAGVLDAASPAAAPQRLSLRDHQMVHGTPLPAKKAHRRLDDAVAVLQHGVVKGRGGANFPFAIKLESTAGARGNPLVVVNAAEGEPASAKDLALLLLAPHLVLDGAITSARLLKCKEIVVWLHHGSPALASLEAAIGERRSDSDVTIRIAQAPDRFVSGQVTSVVQGLSGGTALPYSLRVQPSIKGVKGRPTLVSNAETYALVALTLQHREAAHGRLLTTVMNTDGQRHIVETVKGTPVSSVLSAAGVDATGAPLLVGGYAGSWITSDQIQHATVDDFVLRDPAVRLGVALFAVADPQWCPVVVTAHIASWLAGQSAGQCGPCTFGLPAIADALSRLAKSRPATTDRANLDRWLPLVRGRGACAHPDGTAGLVASLLVAYGTHLNDHASGMPCRGGAATAWPALPSASFEVTSR